MNKHFMKTLRKGWKPIDWLDVSCSEKVFSYSEEVQKVVAIKREELYAAEQAKGKKIRDGDMYRVDAMEITDKKCSVVLGTMRRCYMFVVRFLEELFATVAEEDFVNGIACGALIETADKKFLFGKRNKNRAGRVGGELALIGGLLQPDEGLVETYVGFYDHVCRELLEETGVEASTVADAKIVGIQRMQNGGIAFIYYLALTLTEEEVAAVFSQRSDDEMTDLVYIDRAQVRDYLFDACYEHGMLKRTLGLCCEYVDEILKNTEVMN